MIKFRLILLILLVCCPVIAVADDYLDIIRKDAVSGEVNAQYKLGCMYDTGDGVTQDYKEAAEWYRKAAEQGDASAQLSLGTMYYKGKGVPLDKVKAYDLFMKSGLQGLRVARYALVRLCQESPWACK